MGLRGGREGVQNPKAFLDAHKALESVREALWVSALQGAGTRCSRTELWDVHPAFQNSPLLPGDIRGVVWPGRAAVLAGKRESPPPSWNRPLEDQMASL